MKEKKEWEAQYLDSGICFLWMSLGKVVIISILINFLIYKWKNCTKALKFLIHISFLVNYFVLLWWVVRKCFLGLHNNMSQTIWLKEKEINFFTVLEARSLNSRCQEDHTPSEASWDESLVSPSFWWLSATPGVPCLKDASFQFLPLSSCGLLNSVSVSKFPKDQ